MSPLIIALPEELSDILRCCLMGLWANWCEAGTEGIRCIDRDAGPTLTCLVQFNRPFEK